VFDSLTKSYYYSTLDQAFGEMVVLTPVISTETMNHLLFKRLLK